MAMATADQPFRALSKRILEQLQLTPPVDPEVLAVWGLGLVIRHIRSGVSYGTRHALFLNISQSIEAQQEDLARLCAAHILEYGVRGAVTTAATSALARQLCGVELVVAV